MKIKEKLTNIETLILKKDFLLKLIKISWKKYNIDDLVNLKYISVIKKWEIYFKNKDFKKLVDLKLQEVNYEYGLENNYDLLVKQIETDLKPVLNEEFDFNFEEIYKFILTFKK